MFSIDVVGQDQFLDMPTDSRELYFQLGMYADDEGFVSPRKVMRITGSGSDALAILHAKEFIFSFKSGVIVVKHWKQNNYIQADRFAPTTFKEEKKEWAELQRIQDVYNLDTQGGREVKKERKNTEFSNENQEVAQIRADLNSKYKLK